MRILAVTTLRDEGPFLLDWLAHHRAIGVTDVLAFTNDCRDGTEALADALSPAGLVHVPQGAIRGRDGPTPQWRALAAAWDHPLRAACDWALAIDTDEYVCQVGGSLPDLIAGMPGAQAIALPWRLFGNSGRFEAGQGATPARFRRAAPEAVAYPVLASFFKTLFDLRGPFTGFGVHRPRQAGPPVFHDETGARRDDLAGRPGRILLWRGGRAAQGRRVQLNHYSVRSVEEFLVKSVRGLPNRTSKAIDLTYWVERNFNTVEDSSFDPHLPALEAETARLRALPGVAEAEAASRAWHQAELGRILSTEEGVRLAGRLAMAPSSVVPPPDQLGRLLALTRATHGSKSGDGHARDPE
ncbi:hypothetical protein jaqu_00890 [Jannaschia aquimarina]|uniref:Glycosyl transferase family 2 n=2 Tax=Jannaschia aquimarina TaxID=935700 RepID=A0A0D1ER91_9RHOB|nr:hypothetical protein jaqu_00890 [Jannaschia aquimarina]SNT30598.1 Glycosyl transferase family 2 [Jannaschia aquimarina]